MNIEQKRTLLRQGGNLKGINVYVNKHLKKKNASSGKQASSTNITGSKGVHKTEQFTRGVKSAGPQGNYRTEQV